MPIQPNYVPCADPSFYQYRDYHCCYDSDCFRIYKQNAQCAAVYDGRNNQLCDSDYALSCPC